ncbi:MAG: NADH-quinone oxidoreductase subunit E [Rikenellaceae bacterium]|nr:NADH-quinone oxidoreductase subunit E [Rikenellaceae bacterium]
MLYLLFLLLLISVFVVKTNHKVWVTLGVVGAGAVENIVEAAHALCGEAFRFRLLGTQLREADPLSALFMIIISVAAVATVLYSRGYLARYRDRYSSAHFSLHYMALILLYYSMIGVVKSPGGYDFLFDWELMTISSFLLILFEADRKEVRRAALNYLVMMHIGFLFLLTGFVTLSSQGYGTSFAELTVYFAERNPLPLFAVFLVGFGMKAGLFPLHTWLPEAHPAAPAHISAVMSGVMIKTGVYGVIRVTAAVGDERIAQAGMILLGAGIVTGLWGVILAAVQNDIKRLLAYSSIENIGVIFIGLGAAAIGKGTDNAPLAVCGMAGALLHTVNHSFFKSLLFFGAGNVYSQTHSTSLESFGGLIRSMPVTALLFLTGTTAICALPPLNGFVSEFLIYYGLLDGIAANQQAVIASVCGTVALALIGGVAVLAFSKLYAIVFLGAPRTHLVAEAEEADKFRIAACAIPVAGILAVGLAPALFAAGFSDIASQLLGTEPPHFPGADPSASLRAITVAVWVLVAVVGLLLWWKHRAARRRTVESGPTWGCGFTAPTVRMQYTGESFAEGLQTIATSLTKDTVKGKAVDKDEIFPTGHSFEIKHKDTVDKLFSAWWVAMLRLVNERVMRLRTGKINHYVLFALLFLLLILVLSLLNLI